MLYVDARKEFLPFFPIVTKYLLKIEKDGIEASG
jgi:hypothetical protein